MNEKDHYIHRMNQVNEDLRRRNGELYVALTEADPAKAAYYTPIGGSDKHNIDSRYIKIDRIITSLANAYHRNHNNTLNAEDLIDVANTALDHYQELHNYWIDVETERERRRKEAEKKAATRRANKIAKEQATA